MKRIQLSDNFYLDEFLRSQTATRHGIDMHIKLGGHVQRNLTHLCRCFLQPVRDQFGPVFISSGYRPQLLNAKINGSKNSSHLYGAAADFVVQGHDLYEVALWISANLGGYEQLIYEFGKWLHLSVPVSQRIKPIETDLTAIKEVGRLGLSKTTYLPGVVDHKSFRGAA